MKKKIAIRVFLQTTIIYLVVYLFVSFMYWNFNNPFQWVIDLPNMDSSHRACVLSYIIMYYGLSIFIHYSIIKESKQK